jgi:FG-GAP-like repeat/Bacterial Ig-like domain (group 3)
MKSLRFVSLFASFVLTLLVAPFGPGAHANLSGDMSHKGVASNEVVPMPQLKSGQVFGSPVFQYQAEGSRILAIKDLTGDGRPDVLVSNFFDSSVSFFLGFGDGTFRPTAFSDAGGPVSSIALADVNEDGKTDLVASLYEDRRTGNSGGVAVLFGNGDGSFQSPVIYDTGGFDANSVAIADVNGDGHLDLVVGTNGGSTSVFLNNGDGTFQDAVVYFTGSAESVVMADVNGDSRPDMLVSTNDNALLLFLNNGDGTFQGFENLDVGGWCFGAAVADINGDGKPDVVAGFVSSLTGLDGVSVLLGNGDGTFQPPIVTGVGNDAAGIASIAIQDLDGDGRPDVVLADGNARVLLSNGDGTFQPIQKNHAGSLAYTSTVAVADLNGDGKPDVVMGGGCDRNKLNCEDFQALLNIFDSTTVTAVTASLNPSPVNQAVTFTATVTSNPREPVVGDGAVITFSASKTVLGTGITKNGVATFTTSFPRAKTYSIKASYPGDAYHKASSGAVRELVHP